MPTVWNESIRHRRPTSWVPHEWVCYPIPNPVEDCVCVWCCFRDTSFEHTYHISHQRRKVVRCTSVLVLLCIFFEKIIHKQFDSFQKMITHRNILFLLNFWGWWRQRCMNGSTLCILRHSLHLHTHSKGLSTLKFTEKSGNDIEISSLNLLIDHLIDFTCRHDLDRSILQIVVFTLNPTICKVWTEEEKRQN